MSLHEVMQKHNERGGEESASSIGCYVYGLRHRVEENNSYTYRESNRDAVPNSTDCQCQTVIKSL